MKPNFKDGFAFSKHLFAVEMGKKEITMNKPVYLGQAILDLSKTLMYQFHYYYMRPISMEAKLSCAIWILAALFMR